MRKKITAFQDWLEYRLRILCGKIAIEYRFPAILIMLALFGSVSIYLFVSSIYRIGRQDGVEESLQVNHIEHLEFSSKGDPLRFDKNISELPADKDSITFKEKQDE